MGGLGGEAPQENFRIFRDHEKNEGPGGRSPQEMFSIFRG